MTSEPSVASAIPSGCDPVRSATWSTAPAEPSVGSELHALGVVQSPRELDERIEHHGSAAIARSNADARPGTSALVTAAPATWSERTVEPRRHAARKIGTS